ncbi:hypothetical protein MAR_023294, partial [Mya arenaria]
GAPHPHVLHYFLLVLEKGVVDGEAHSEIHVPLRYAHPNFAYVLNLRYQTNTNGLGIKLMTRIEFWTPTTDTNPQLNATFTSIRSTF